MALKDDFCFEMAPPRNQPPSRNNTSSSYSPSAAFRETSTPSLCGGGGEVLVEICTPGARSPIHFVEGYAASCRGRSHTASSARTTSSSSSGRSFMSTTLSNPQPALAPVTPTPSKTNNYVKHHRRTSTPLDGVCFTLQGVSSSLQEPGVDVWSVAEALVDCGVDLRTRNARGMTPLHLACSAGQVIKDELAPHAVRIFSIINDSSKRGCDTTCIQLSWYCLSSRARLTAACVASYCCIWYLLLRCSPPNVEAINPQHAVVFVNKRIPEQSSLSEFRLVPHCFKCPVSRVVYLWHVISG